MKKGRTALITVGIRNQTDVVNARQRSRLLAQLLGFDRQDQTRIATAVSEVARNAFQYGRGGSARFFLEEAPSRFVVEIADEGPGIADLPLVLSGNYVSATGMGVGLLGAQRLMDGVHIDSKPGGGGTRVFLWKDLRTPPPRGAELDKIISELARTPSTGPYDELQQQNQELVEALNRLRGRERELEDVNGRLALANASMAATNAELEETNRGVAALYAELDVKAAALARANRLKTHFLSNMSHEFRTPLNAIQGISQILLNRLDGELTDEQEIQVELMRTAATELLEMVNDLLDLAKVEAGKLEVHPREFSVARVFLALQGLMRPLLPAHGQVSLVVDALPAPIKLFTDEGKLEQILRNLVSNALKFTERGEVRIGCEVTGDGFVLFTVKDSGVGIAPADQARIFEEFRQVESMQHRTMKGTGLGLPLASRLAQLLGGTLTVSSVPGVGSTFTARLPQRLAPLPEADDAVSPVRLHDPTRFPLLVVAPAGERAAAGHTAEIERMLEGSAYQTIPVSTLAEAGERVAEGHVAAILLNLEGEHGGEARARIREWKSADATRDLPILVWGVSADREMALDIDADAFILLELGAGELLARLDEVVRMRRQLDVVLVVDDEAAARYVLRSLLSKTRFSVMEAGNGREGIARAKELLPTVIILDFLLQDMNAFTVLSRLHAEPSTRDIPVILNTSELLTPEQRSLLSELTVAVLSKETHSRSESFRQLRMALTAALTSTSARGSRDLNG